MIKKIDFLGRIVIPKNIRDELQLTPNSSVQIKFDSQRKEIVLEKEEAVCCICGASLDLIQKNKFFICRACLKKIKDD